MQFRPFQNAALRMVRKKTYLLMVLHFITIFIARIRYSNCLDSPEYRVVLRMGSDSEIRLYRESQWVSASIKNSTSFEKTTKDGFHRVYQYIHGANLNSSQIAKTAPVLTTSFRATPTTAAATSDSYVKFYLPAKYQAAPPPLPGPELGLHLEKWKAQCFAVRKFTGFAKDEGVSRETNALVTTLNNNLPGRARISDSEAYFFTVAQYNASFHLSGRLNEVWFNVSAFAFEGCPPF